MTPTGPSASRALVAALAAVAVAALAACGERPAPSPSFEPSAEAPRSEELAGAPPPAPLPPPPPVEAAPPPPPPPPPVEAPRPGDRDVVYDLGPVVGSRPQVSPEDAYPSPPPRRREHRRYEMARAQEPRPVPEVRAAPPPRPAPAAPHGRTAPSHAAMTHKAPTHPAVAAAPAPRKPAVSHTPPQVTASKPAAAKAPAVAAKTTVAKSEVAKPAAAKTIATTTTKAGGHVATTAHAKAKPPAPPAKPDAKAQGDRGERLQRLQAALKDAVAAKATLSTPDSRLAGQPADVTLALPADFAQTVRTEAEKAGLADAAASVNLTAQLAGDGYAITPGETQSQPLTVGQPTEFHWTATAQPNTKGPLRADVGADLLGGGSESLALGQVATTNGGGMRLSSRAVGLGLLVLIAVVVLAWLARSSGRTPAQRASARAAANRDRNGLTSRPLDMSGRPMGPPAVDRDPTLHPGPRDGPPPP